MILAINMTNTRNKEIRVKRKLIVMKLPIFLLVVFFSLISLPAPLPNNEVLMVNLKLDGVGFVFGLVFDGRI